MDASPLHGTLDERLALELNCNVWLATSLCRDGRDDRPNQVGRREHAAVADGFLSDGTWQICAICPVAT